MIDQDIESKDMAPYSILTSLFILGASIGGMYIYTLLKKTEEIEWTMYNVSSNEEVQDAILKEHDQRIREKNDYDETDELEEDVYQGWSGKYYVDNLKITITLWREKVSTVKKNQEWRAWTGEKNGSCVVRDFYLGNSNPDFQWKTMTVGDIYSGLVTETMINGWDSLVKLEILVYGPAKEEILSYMKTDEKESDNSLFNSFLKKTIDETLIEWSRVVIPC